jgi:Nif-specific regulatory protein
MLVRKNQELSAILHISQLLTSSFDLEKNLNAVMESLAGRLEMQRGCVFLLDQLSKELQIVAAYGLRLFCRKRRVCWINRRCKKVLGTSPRY